MRRFQDRFYVLVLLNFIKKIKLSSCCSSDGGIPDSTTCPKATWDHEGSGTSYAPSDCCRFLSI